jgi:hypothetical protein
MEYSRIEACPLDRTKRSRSGQCDACGSCRMMRVHSTWASGARAMAVPECPELACSGRVHGQAADHVDAELHQGRILHDRSDANAGAWVMPPYPTPRLSSRLHLTSPHAGAAQQRPHAGHGLRRQGHPGRCTWRMTADERFANPAGIMQGGFLGAFADSAMGAAAVTFVQGRKVFAANAEMKISFLAPVPPAPCSPARPRSSRAAPRWRSSRRAFGRSGGEEPASGWWPGPTPPTSSRDRD